MFFKKLISVAVTLGILFVLALVVFPQGQLPAKPITGMHVFLTLLSIFGLWGIGSIIYSQAHMMLHDEKNGLLASIGLVVTVASLLVVILLFRISDQLSVLLRR